MGRPAAADLADLAGIDPAQQAAANPVALGGGPTGAITGNPALLDGEPPLRVAGLASAWDRSRVRLAARPDGVDVAPSIYRARRADGSEIPHFLATEDLRPRGGTGPSDAELGLWATSGGTFGRDGRVTVAGMGYLPLRAIAQATAYADEREAPLSNTVRPALIRDDLGGLVLAGGLAVRATRWLALGASAKVLVSARPVSRVYSPDPLAGRDAQINLETRVVPDVVPAVGAVARPWSALELGASARPAHGLTTRGASIVELWNDSDGELALDQALDFVYDWQPARIAVGAGWRAAWTLAAEAVYRRWSGYRDHHGEVPRPGFADIVELGINATAPVRCGRVVAGARWIPSPVPAQLGRTNFADADRAVVAGGLALEPRIAGRKVRIAFALQTQWLRRRTTFKTAGAAEPVLDEFPDAIDLDGTALAESRGLQTNNPGYPGFTIEGWIFAGGVSASWELP
jgi:long-chain fatty acid transport protein